MNKEYLPHIDILRAIAVFLVIFHHLDINLFSGGFIGVDIFFVISGYLITKNIQQDVRQNKFSLLNFYQRRVMRLAPAFFTMLICCSFAFWIFSTAIPSELDNYFKSLIAAVCLFINIYLWQSLSDYFSINASITPLLHIWSLSLEEQFYLLWPTLFLIFTKFHYRIKTIFFIIIFTISFIYSYYSAIESPISAYYLLLSRIFEFMIGAFIITLPKIKIKKIKKLLFTTLILFIILYLSITLNKESIFPSYNALIICCASAIYIYIARIDAQIKYWKPLLYLGKISYPMYLWHWPIIVTINIHSIVLDVKIKFIIVITVLILAHLTYEKIEKPSWIFMKNHRNIIKEFFIFPTLIIILVSITSINYLKNEKKTSLISNNYNIRNDSIRCIDRDDHPIEECFLGDLSQKDTKILLLGDSHANAQRGFIDVLANNALLKGYEITYSSSIFLPNLERFSKSRHSKEEELIPHFRLNNIKSTKTIKENKFKYIILGGFFPHNSERNIYSLSIKRSEPEVSHQLFIFGLNSAIKLIIENNAIPIIINDNPILQDVDINCHLRTNTPETKCLFARQKHDQDFRDWMKDLESLKIKYPQLIVLDFNSIICSKTSCYSYLNNIPLYRDNQHLTYSGSTEIGREYLKKYGNPLKSYEK